MFFCVHCFCIWSWRSFSHSGDAPDSGISEGSKSVKDSGPELCSAWSGAPGASASLSGWSTTSGAAASVFSSDTRVLLVRRGRLAGHLVLFASFERTQEGPAAATEFWSSSPFTYGCDG